MEKPKQFLLKPIEQHLLRVVSDQFQIMQGNILSFIALERLAYKVTEKTYFKIEGDTLLIGEEPQERPATEEK